MIAKFVPWSHETYHKSEHPEYVAIRNIISKNPQHNFLLVGVGGQRYEYFKEKGISFYNICSNTKIRYLSSLFLRFELAFLSKPSVIVAMGVTDLIPFGIASILTRAKFIPIVTGEIRFSIQNTPKPLRRIFAFLLKIALYKSCAILTLSRSIKEELIDNYSIDPEKTLIYKYKISEIFNPNASKKFKSLLNPNGPIVMSICRISPEKGLHYVIEASRIITGKILNVKIVIKGSLGAQAPLSEKKYEQKLRKLIHKYDLQEHITILKSSPYSEIPMYMSASDVFVLPSISEGLPMVILEALATGVPVVASKVGGIPDVLIHEYNGLLVKPQDPDDLAEAIIRILSDDKLKRRLIEDGLATIRRMKENEIEKLLSKLIFEK
jgi:glycosyltransferase involved in cell wall biosynthesis